MSHLEQLNVLTALSAGAEVDAFLGNVVEIAIVTRDHKRTMDGLLKLGIGCLLYTSPSPRDRTRSRMPSSA